MSKLLVIYTYGKHCITLHHIVQYIKLPITEPVNSSNRRNKTALVGLQRFTVVKGFRFRIWKLNKNQINENGWICCENPQFSITTYRCAIWKKIQRRQIAWSWWPVHIAVSRRSIGTFFIQKELFLTTCVALRAILLKIDVVNVDFIRLQS